MLYPHVFYIGLCWYTVFAEQNPRWSSIIGTAHILIVKVALVLMNKNYINNENATPSNFARSSWLTYNFIINMFTIRCRYILLSGMCVFSQSTSVGRVCLPIPKHPEYEMKLNRKDEHCCFAECYGYTA